MKLFNGKIRMINLGITKAGVQNVLEDLEKIAPIDETPTELLAMDVMDQLQEQNSAKWCLAEEVGLDWDRVFDLIIRIIEKLLPLIVKRRPPIPVYTHSAQS